MSLGTIQRSALAIEREIQTNIQQYLQCKNDFHMNIKAALNHQLHMQKLRDKFYEPRLLEQDEILDLDELKNELTRAIANYDDCRRVLRQKVTNAQNSLLKYKSLVHAIHNDFGRTGIECKIRGDMDLTDFGDNLHVLLQDLWTQYELDTFVMNSMEKDPNRISYQNAQVLVSIWQHSPFL